MDEAPSLWSLYDADFSSTSNTMEPLFVLLMSVIKTFGGNLQTLFFGTALFNTYAIVKFIKHCRANLLLCLAIYFCWLYLPVQMGVVRQSIALSFLMLSLIEYDKKHAINAIALFTTGLFFQFSLILFAPIFFPRVTIFLLNRKQTFIFAMIVLYLSNFSLFEGLNFFASLVNNELISQKLSYYYNTGPAAKSEASIIYFFLCIFILFYFSWNKAQYTRLELALFSSLFLMTILQATFWEFPLVWNRAQYFTVIAQSVLLSWNITKQKLNQRIVVLILVFLFSMSVLLKILFGESSIIFLPYQSYFSNLITDSVEDGRTRTEDFYKKFEDLSNK